MLKHALSAGAVGVTAGTGTVRHYPGGGGGGRNAYRSPPPPLDHSYHGGTGLRSFTPANPYSNLSALSNSKRSGGGSPPHPNPHPHPRLANGGPRHPPPPGFVEIKLGSGQGQTRLDHSNHSHQRTLDASALSASKHSLGGNSSSVSPPLANGGLGLTGAGRLPGSPLPPAPPRLVTRVRRPGVREMLTSLGLLCLVSLLLALLSLVFMLKISPVTAADVKELIRSDQVTVISPEEYVLVYEVTLALCALSLSLNLCCLLVCAVQFLFAVKLVRDSPDGERTNKYLKKSAFTRVCAVGGFFVSIPVFLTGIILYTFIQFHSTPAVVTSILIGLGIMFCGCAMVHNVFVWQKEKTNAVRALAQQHRLAIQREQSLAEQSRNIGLPICLPVNGNISPGPIHSNTHFDLNNETPTPPEICTLV